MTNGKAWKISKTAGRLCYEITGCPAEATIALSLLSLSLPVGDDLYPALQGALLEQ